MGANISEIIIYYTMQKIAAEEEYEKQQIIQRKLYENNIKYINNPLYKYNIL